MIARTMELSNIAGRVSYNIEAVPAHVSGGKFAFVAPFNIFHIPPLPSKVALEGINEVGFTASALALEESVYEDEHEAEGGLDEGKPAVSYSDVVRQLLMHCDSVEAALAFLASVRVVRDAAGILKPLLAKEGLHWALADASGRSVVVEYLEGQRVVSENAPRVMTNDPNLQWQWRNLNTYVSLSPHFPTQNDFLQVELDHGMGRVPRAVGHGWNLHGLPGDSSPPSRFARLFYLRGYALRASAPSDESDAVVLGTALLNNVFIPFGTVAPNPAPAPGVDRPEFTPYGVIKSPAEKKLLVRGYRNTQWRQIDLNKLDLTKAQTWPLEDGSLGIADITGQGTGFESAGLSRASAEVAALAV